MKTMKYNGKAPQLANTAKVFDTATVLGDVILHDHVSVWFGAVIRGDMEQVEIGEGTNIQDNAVVHTSIGKPTKIGKYVTVGHGAIIHGATVEDGALIGMGSIVLDGAVIGNSALVAAGCVVPPGKVIPPRSLVIGNPMKMVRTLSDDEVQEVRKNQEHYVVLKNQYE